jgi:hypothetical protein
VELTEPAGNSTSWHYAGDDEDPRNRGNCLRRIDKPAPGAPADHTSLVTAWTWDREFQAPLTERDTRSRTTTTAEYEETYYKQKESDQTVETQTIEPA